MTRKVLIVGSGSVGKRHAENISKLGYRLSCIDPRPERLREMSALVAVESSYGSLEDALDSEEKFCGIIVCSPPKFHVEQALQGLNAGLHVLLEKPVCKSLLSAKKLANACQDCEVKGGPYLLLAYTWRWWPALVYLRQQIKTSSIGKPLFARFHVSAHLADWHPWEDYREFFMSSEEQGGGALLDESHWIDQMLWYFGLPERLIGTVSRISELEISSDDSVDVLAVYSSGLKVSLHLDIFGRPHEKTIQVIGSDGELMWRENPNYVIQTNHDRGQIKKHFDNNRNDMFVGVAQEFETVMNGLKPSTCNIFDGIDTLRIIEAIRRSNESQQFVDNRML